MNVLVLGCDSDYVEHLDHPVVVKGAPGRSDAMMVAHIDFDKQTINVLSIPRDTAAPIPGLRGYHKINAAHTFGGNDLSARTVAEDFGIPIDHTISLDFDSFQKVVDKIGGVDIVVHKKLDYDDNWGNLHVHLKPGFQHLNGYKAMGYVRIRHSDNDLMRAERQHEFIEALRNQIQDPKTFKALPDAVNLVTDDIKSDFRSDSNSSGMDKELCLVNFARTLPPGNIHLATLEGDEGRSYVYAYPDKARAIIGQMFFGGDTDAVTLKIASRETVLAMNSGRRRGRVSRVHRRRAHTATSSPTRSGASPAVQDGSTNTTATEATDRTPVDGGDSSPRGDGAGSSGSGSSGDDGSGKGKGGDGSSDNQRSDIGTGAASEQSNALAWFHTSV